MRRFTLLRVVATVLLLGSLGFPREAAAQSAGASVVPEATAVCISQYEAAQLDSNAGRLVSARAQAELCARDTCPTLVRGFCLKLAEEYAQKIPSVVVSARGADGCDTTNARVLLDGNAWQDKLDGRAVQLNPGEHTIRVEVAGAAAEEQVIVAAQGEQDRVLSFGQARKALCGRAATTDPRTPVQAASDRAMSGLTLGGLLLGGFSLASLATAGGLGISGLVQRGDLEDCKPCSESQVDDVRRTFIIGDVFLATGAVALGISIGLLVAGGNDQPTQAGYVVPTLDGGGVMAGFGSVF